MEKWYVIQTRPRWEKKVSNCLVQKGIQTYCPVKKIKRKWSDRVKTLEEPIFKAYVFVKITSDQRTVVRLTQGVMNFVHRNAKPALVKEKEMRSLMKSLDKVTLYEVSENGDAGQRKPFQTYLDSFNEWLIACVERPNSFRSITIDS